MSSMFAPATFVWHACPRLGAAVALYRMRGAGCWFVATAERR